MTEAEIAARAEAKQVVATLREIRNRLQRIHASLPVPPNETEMLEGEEEPDVSTEVRSIIECVLGDQIGPAIRDLTAAAKYRPSRRKRV